jgi:hypothetical protein
LPVLAALRAQLEQRRLGEGPRTDLKRWYWCNVFLERYSSAVESKSRKDYAEMLAHWTEKGTEPAVFGEARARIGADGYTIRDSASGASAVYSGVFSLLAINGARDWTRAETIQLQDLDDHHIFPQAYLKRHGITKRVDVNTILNRTLISDETNRRISDKAPAVYLQDKKVFPTVGNETTLVQHFIGAEVYRFMTRAVETLSEEETREVYEDFLHAREQMIVSTIRQACGLAH